MKVIPADFTLGELRAFIEGEKLDAVEGFYTTREWADHFGISTYKMRALLREAKDKGILEMTFIEKTTLDEKPCKVPVYALKRVGENERCGD